MAVIPECPEEVTIQMQRQHVIESKLVDKVADHEFRSKSMKLSAIATPKAKGWSVLKKASLQLHKIIDNWGNDHNGVAPMLEDEDREGDVRLVDFLRPPQYSNDNATSRRDNDNTTTRRGKDDATSRRDAESSPLLKK